MPDAVATICNKFGAHNPCSSGKQGSQASASNAAKMSKPGSCVQRQLSTKTRRTLHRIATDVSQAGSLRPPSLARSATDSIVPELKCEAEEVGLEAIPAFARQRPLSGRGGLPQFKRSGPREVDLRAVSTYHESTLQKKASIDDELKAAITALKKPNRGLAVKEYVESADRRVNDVTGHRSRSKGVIDHKMFSVNWLQRLQIP